SKWWSRLPSGLEVNSRRAPGWVVLMAAMDADTSDAGFAAASADVHLASSSRLAPMHRKPETAFTMARRYFPPERQVLQVDLVTAPVEGDAERAKERFDLQQALGCLFL